MITKDLLHAIRTDMPMKLTILRLGCHAPIAKQSDGYFRFQCPRCCPKRKRVYARIDALACASGLYSLRPW